MIPRALFRKIRRIEVRTKGLVHDVFGGEYHSAFKGRGIEFAEVRPYQIGDDIRTIDWNVSARTGETHVKVYEEEREQTLILAVDVSGSGDFGSVGRAKREIAAEVCAVLGFSALQNSDKVGLLLFSDHVERFIPPKKGRQHVLRLVRDLFVHEPQARGTDLRPALDHLLHALRRRAIVLLLSDFLLPPGLHEPTSRALRTVSKKHDLVAVHLRDPREGKLPNVGLLTLTDAETGQPVTIDTRSRRARARFAEQAASRQARIAATLRRARIDTVEVATDADYVEPLVAFFRRRNRER
ncbi:MAG: DUF58 domain-containing protein [Bacteroidota bacterium]